MIKQFYLTTPGQNEPNSNGNEWVFHIPQSFKTLVGGVVESFLAAEMQLVYSTSPAD